MSAKGRPRKWSIWAEPAGAGAATRQFQLTRLYAELSAAEAIEREVDTPHLSSPTARRLGYRALSSYLAGAIVFRASTIT